MGKAGGGKGVGTGIGIYNEKIVFKNSKGNIGSKYLLSPKITQF